MDITLGQKNSGKLFDGYLVAEHILHVLLWNAVVKEPCYIIGRLFIINFGLNIRNSSRYISNIGLQSKACAHFCGRCFSLHLSFKLTDSSSLGFDCITYGFEGQLHDILYIFPLVFALKEVVHQAWCIRVSLDCHGVWIHMVQACRDWLTILLIWDPRLQILVFILEMDAVLLIGTHLSDELPTLGAWPLVVMRGLVLNATVVVGCHLRHNVGLLSLRHVASQIEDTELLHDSWRPTVGA